MPTSGNHHDKRLLQEVSSLVCNPHPYNVPIGWHQKLGIQIDIHGPCELNLFLEENCVFKVALVEVRKDSVGMELSWGEKIDLTILICLNSNKDSYVRCCWSGKKYSQSITRTWNGLSTTLYPCWACCTYGGDVLACMYKEMKTLFTDMLDKGVIRDSCSPWPIRIMCRIL